MGIDDFTFLVIVKSVIYWFSVSFVALAAVCLIAIGDAARVNSRTSSKANATGMEEDFDEFVPYQGDRFDIFDWDLSKVRDKTLINDQVTSLFKVFFYF